MKKRKYFLWYRSKKHGIREYVNKCFRKESKPWHLIHKKQHLSVPSPFLSHFSFSFLFTALYETQQTNHSSFRADWIGRVSDNLWLRSVLYNDDCSADHTWAIMRFTWIKQKKYIYTFVPLSIKREGCEQVLWPNWFNSLSRFTKWGLQQLNYLFIHQQEH